MKKQNQMICKKSYNQITKKQINLPKQFNIDINIKKTNKIKNLL